MNQLIAVLYVCVANISRSRAGEFCLKHIVEENNMSSKIHVDSCGIGHVLPGSKPNSSL